MLQERNGSPSVMTLKLLKSTLRGSMLQLQISTDCRAHRSPMQWESLVIGPQAAQTPFELRQWRAQMCWYTSLFPLLSLGRLSQCLCCWKVHFPSAMLSSSCHPYLSSWRKMPWRFPMCSRSLFFFFLQNIFPHLKWIPLHQLLLDQLLILLRFSFFKQAKAVWSTRPTVDIYSISFSRSGLPWWLSSKESAGNAGDTGTWVQSLGGEDLLEEEIATHSSILAWTIQWTEEPGELQPKGSQRIGHDWVFLQLGMTSGTWSHWPP